MSTDRFEALRQRMLAEVAAETIYVSARIGKAALAKPVMEAMGNVPRHEFVPLELQPYAYLNRPLPIGCDKTISQPFIVALMTDLLGLEATDAVLEIGTGLGYQAAILAELARKVYSVEIIEELARQAEQRLGRLGYTNIELKLGNGYYGWPEHAPFDKSHRDRGARPYSPAAHRATKTRRQNGDSGWPARGTATEPAHQTEGR